MKKEIFIGFTVGLLATICGCYIFIEFSSKHNFYESLKLISKANLYGKILVLGAIANLFVFFIFLKKRQIYRARGVLLETFLIAFLVVFLTLFK